MMDLELDWAELLRRACGLGDDLSVSEELELAIKLAVQDVLTQDTENRQHRAMLEWGFSQYQMRMGRLNQLYPQIDFNADDVIILFGETLDRVRHAFLELCR